MPTIASYSIGNMRTRSGAAYFYGAVIAAVISVGLLRPGMHRHRTTVVEIAAPAALWPVNTSAVITRVLLPVPAQLEITSPAAALAPTCIPRSSSDVFHMTPVTAATSVSPTNARVLRWPAPPNLACGVAMRAGAYTDDLLPDGRILFAETFVSGNQTQGLCLGGVGGWRTHLANPVHPTILRDDNQAQLVFAGFNSSSYTGAPLLPCRGYRWRPSVQTNCLAPVDLLIAGLAGVQPVHTLTDDVLVYGIRLQPRNPWRAFSPLYTVTTAWDIPFQSGPNGQFTADLRPDGHWSDLLGPTVVRVACAPLFGTAQSCKPVPLDIYLCTDACPCSFLTTPTTTPTTTLTTTITPTSSLTTTPTTTTPLPVCRFAQVGGACQIESARPTRSAPTQFTLLNTTLAALVNAADSYATPLFTIANPAAIPIVITRDAACFEQCTMRGLQCSSDANAGVYGTVVHAAAPSLSAISVQWARLLLLRNCSLFPGTFCSGHDYISQASLAVDSGAQPAMDFIFEGTCDGASSNFAAGDCCYHGDFETDRAFVSLFVRSYQALALVALQYEAASCYAAGNANHSAPLLLVNVHSPVLEIQSDQRGTFDESQLIDAPDQVLSVASFDVIDTDWDTPVSGTTVRLVQWEVRSPDGVVAGGPMNVTCTAGSECSIRILFRGHAAWRDYWWILRSDHQLEGTSSVIPLLNGPDFVQAACPASLPYSYPYLWYQLPIEMMLNFYYALTSSCMPHLPPPSNNITRLMERVIAGDSVDDACDAGVCCIDARSL